MYDSKNKVYIVIKRKVGIKQKRYNEVLVGKADKRKYSTWFVGFLKYESLISLSHLLVMKMCRSNLNLPVREKAVVWRK